MCIAVFMTLKSLISAWFIHTIIAKLPIFLREERVKTTQNRSKATYPELT